MNYLVAVLSDRIQAEAAYTKLEKVGLPMDRVSILGRGYKSADEFGLSNPFQQGRKQASFMAYWLIPFGFISGIVFVAMTQLDTFAWAGTVGNYIIGGLLGSGAGAMGSIFVGGGMGIAMGSGDSLPYRNRLGEGKYLLVVQGSENLIKQAKTIVLSFNPEGLKSYMA